jgi:hypothetical protein
MISQGDQNGQVECSASVTSMCSRIDLLFTAELKDVWLDSRPPPTTNSWNCPLDTTRYTPCSSSLYRGRASLTPSRPSLTGLARSRISVSSWFVAARVLEIAQARPGHTQQHRSEPREDGRWVTCKLQRFSTGHVLVCPWLNRTSFLVFALYGNFSSALISFSLHDLPKKC